MSGLINAIKRFFQSPVTSAQTPRRRKTQGNAEQESHQSPVIDRSENCTAVSENPLPITHYPLPTTEDLKQSLFVVQKPKSPENRVSSTLQAQLDGRSPDEKITLFPTNGEYEAPVTIRQPVTLDGKGATIWGKTGTVMAIESDRVNLKNLRIEATDPENTQSAIRVASGKNITLENVEVKGMVVGIPTETGVWDYPEALNLGQLPHGCEHEFKIRIVVPLPCQIIDEIAGLEFFPRRLQPGANEVALRLERVPKDTLIFGSVFLVSDSLKRRLTVSAQVLSLSHQTPTQGKLIWEAKNWQKSSPMSPSPPSLYGRCRQRPDPAPSTPSKICRQQMPSSTSWLIDSADRPVSATSPQADHFSPSKKMIKNTFSVTNDTKMEEEGKNSPQFNCPSIPNIFLQENN